LGEASGLIYEDGSVNRAVLLVLVALFFKAMIRLILGFAIQKIEIKGDFKYAVEDDLQADFSSLLGRVFWVFLYPTHWSLFCHRNGWQSAEIRNSLAKLHCRSLFMNIPLLQYWGDRQLISTSAGSDYAA